MKKFILKIILLISFSSFSQSINEALESVFKKHNLMGLTVQTFTKNEQKSHNFGFINLNHNEKINNDTKFRIASISKTYTALGLLKLYDKKLFKLDDDISKYLGYKVANPNFPEDKITFRMLLNHTSSLQDGTGYDSFLGATFSEKIIPNISSVVQTNGIYYTTNMWLKHKPGTFFTYCNLNYGIIGTLIEKISGQRFDIYMRNEILRPLGISGDYNLNEIDIKNLATLYRGENQNWKSQKDDYILNKPNTLDLTNYQIGTNAILLSPQGGLRISSSDLIKLLKYLKSKGNLVPNLISKKTLKTMIRSEWLFKKTNGDNYNGFFKKYSLGLHKTNMNSSDIINNPKTFDAFIGHAGDAYGLISDAYFSKKLNFGFVIITNGSLNEFAKGKNSSFYEFEEEIFKIICEDYIKNEYNKN